MSRYREILLMVVTVLLLGAGVLFGQETGEAVGERVIVQQTTFFSIVLSAGFLGLLNWGGIFLWAILCLPLGILSIIQCSSERGRRFPLATKALFLGAVWLFVLGWVGAVQGTISACSSLAQQAPEAGMLAANISHALFSLSGALAVCQFYLLFIGVSLIVRHVSTARLPPPLSQSRESSV